jgi:acyl-CoA synthetase (AMP-forming)/AMP-acid ligase II
MGTAGRIKLAFDRSLTLGTITAALAEAHDDRVLLVDPLTQKDYTARSIAERVSTIAALVRKGSEPNDRVVVALANGVEFFLTCLGVLAAQRVVVPVHSSLRTDELRHVVEDCGAKLVLKKPLGGSHPTVLSPTPPLHANDVAAILYTSGTTGLPKGAELTHVGLLAGVQRLAALPFGWRDDEVICALPISHVMGFSALLGLMCAGIRTVVFERFRPSEVLDALESRKSSGFIGVPAMYRMLEESGASNRNLRSVRVWMSGADAMPPALIATFQQYGAVAALPFLGTQLGQATFVEGYGMVELSGGVATKITPPYAGRWFTKPVAIPLPGNQLRVVDDEGHDVGPGQVGELMVSGPGVFNGYNGYNGYNGPEDLEDPDVPADKIVGVRTNDGWVRTGDLARRRAFGAVELAGRAKNVIKVGGYSVFAAEVERVLNEHELVDEAIVVGITDLRTGEAVGAVLRSGRKLGSKEIESIATYAKERLSKYKVPTHWRMIDEFDRTTTGKVRRENLRGLFV